LALASPDIRDPTTFTSIQLFTPSPPSPHRIQPRKPHMMDSAIDLTDASSALDLANIRYQLMYMTSAQPRLSSDVAAELRS
jgi:hypothetical protein